MIQCRKQFNYWRKNMEVENKKRRNPFVAILKTFAILLACSFIICMVYFVFFAKVKVSYNGMEYNGLDAYVYVEIYNKSTSQIQFDRTNFSTKGNDIAKIAYEMYVMSSDKYIYQSSPYYLSSMEKIKIRLVFHGIDIPSEGSLYYNGELVSKL